MPEAKKQVGKPLNILQAAINYLEEPSNLNEKSLVAAFLPLVRELITQSENAEANGDLVAVFCEQILKNATLTDFNEKLIKCDIPNVLQTLLERHRPPAESTYFYDLVIKMLVDSLVKLQEPLRISVHQKSNSDPNLLKILGCTLLSNSTKLFLFENVQKEPQLVDRVVLLINEIESSTNEMTSFILNALNNSNNILEDRLAVIAQERSIHERILNELSFLEKDIFALPDPLTIENQIKRDNRLHLIQTLKDPSQGSQSRLSVYLNEVQALIFLKTEIDSLYKREINDHNVQHLLKILNDTTFTILGKKGLYAAELDKQQWIQRCAEVHQESSDKVVKRLLNMLTETTKSATQRAQDFDEEKIQILIETCDELLGKFESNKVLVQRLQLYKSGLQDKSFAATARLSHFAQNVIARKRMLKGLIRENDTNSQSYLEELMALNTLEQKSDSLAAIKDAHVEFIPFEQDIVDDVCIPLLNNPSIPLAKKTELYTFILSNIKERDAENLLENLSKAHEHEQLSLYENEVELISHNIVQDFIYDNSPTENMGVSHIIRCFENVAISATERVKNFELYRLESLILICDQRIKELEAPTTIFSGKQQAIGLLRDTRAILNNATSENAKSKIAEFQAKIEENKTILTKNGIFNSLWALIAPIFSLTLKPQKKSDVFINAVAQLGEKEGGIELRSRSNSDANSPTEAKDIPSATRRNFIGGQETTSSLQARSSSYLQQCSNEVISSLPPMPGHTPGVSCS